MYGSIECEGCGHATVGKIVGDVVPAGRDSCPECGGAEFAVIE